ncbi:hypothetical protein BC941DRAFT_416553 [Chlamydoabsidia padenii]|nr:hypothetical protein BC941DRAFT_416553 [Chlamydoabsidia padenii]
MVELDNELLKSKKFITKFNQILKEGDPATLTASSIRRELEDFFDLERNALKAQPWKSEINAMIDEYTATLDEEEETADSENEKTSSDTKNNIDIKEEKEKKEEDQEDNKQQDDHQDKHEEVFDTDDTNEKAKVVLKQGKKARNSPTKKRTINSSDNDEDDVSPPRKRKTKQQQQQPKDKSPEKEHASKIKKPSADDETIKRLKGYIRKCGVPIIRQSELADCPTKKSQIQKLKSMLEDLGVEGRPTIEKCEKVKVERELKKEIDSLDTDNILESSSRGPSLRSRTLSSNKKKRRIVEEEEEDGDSDDAPRPLDLSFLGDQSDDDSD